MSTEKRFMTEKPRPAAADKAPPFEHTRAEMAYWRGVMEAVGEFDSQKPRIRLIGKRSFLDCFARLLDDHIEIVEAGEPRQDKVQATENAAYYRGILDADPPSDPAEKARLELNADTEAWYQLEYEGDKAREIARSLKLAGR